MLATNRRTSDRVNSTTIPLSCLSFHSTRFRMSDALYTSPTHPKPLHRTNPPASSRPPRYPPPAPVLPCASPTPSRSSSPSFLRSPEGLPAGTPSPRAQSTRTPGASSPSSPRSCLKTPPPRARRCAAARASPLRRSSTARSASAGSHLRTSRLLPRRASATMRARVIRPRRVEVKWFMFTLGSMGH